MHVRSSFLLLLLVCLTFACSMTTFVKAGPFPPTFPITNHTHHPDQTQTETETHQSPQIDSAEFTLQLGREWASFQSRFHTQYDSLTERLHRFRIFSSNLKFILSMNSKQKNFQLAVNQFADLTLEEWRERMGKTNATAAAAAASSNMAKKHHHHHHHRRQHHRSHGHHHTVAANITTPAPSIDWRTRNAVTSIKNQQGCGCDYAFAAVAAVEGAHAIKTGTLLTLSEQQIVDCSEPQGNQGCEGGGVDNSFNFLISSKGIASEVTYPYTAESGVCESPPIVASISSFVDVNSGDEDALVDALNIAPVTAYVDSSNQAWQFYSMGILDDPSCGTKVDHAIAVIGYGTDAKSSKPYYIVKNQWGPIWGQQGYAQLARNVNQCGIATRMSYAVV